MSVPTRDLLDDRARSPRSSNDHPLWISADELPQFCPRAGEVISDHQLAWLLADAVGEALRRVDRTMLFVELGGGNPLPAIDRILTAAAGGNRQVDAYLLSLVDTWLDRYVGFGFEPRLRKLINRIPAAGTFVKPMETRCACRTSNPTSAAPDCDSRERPHRR